MKILLVGEYSNVHWTLAEGLRALGHDVTVVSDGDRWKDYPRDISIVRRGRSLISGVKYLVRLARVWPRLKGYDVVQLINPVFLDLKAERIMPFYRRLRRNNGKVFMGAFGIDKYWVKAGLNCRTFRYSDFNIGSELRHNADNDLMIADWLRGAKGVLNDQVANDCDGIIAGLYEYYASYNPYFSEKLRFIPFPIFVDESRQKLRKADDGIVKFFVGVQKARSAYKGTDIMLKALRRVEAETGRRPAAIFMQNHGLIAHSDDPDECLRIHTDVNDRIARAFGIQNGDFPAVSIRELGDGLSEAVCPYLTEQLASGDFSEKFLLESPLYPDQLVFLTGTFSFGEGMPAEGQAVCNPKTGAVTFNMPAAKAQVIAETLTAIVFICRTIAKNGYTLSTMGEAAKAFIANWESEKYRKSLAGK